MHDHGARPAPTSEGVGGGRSIDESDPVAALIAKLNRFTEGVRPLPDHRLARLFAAPAGGEAAPLSAGADQVTVILGPSANDDSTGADDPPGVHAAVGVDAAATWDGTVGAWDGVATSPVPVGGPVSDNRSEFATSADPGLMAVGEPELESEPEPEPASGSEPGPEPMRHVLEPDRVPMRFEPPPALAPRTSVGGSAVDLARRLRTPALVSATVALLAAALVISLGLPELLSTRVGSGTSTDNGSTDDDERAAAIPSGLGGQTATRPTSPSSETDRSVLEAFDSVPGDEGRASGPSGASAPTSSTAQPDRSPGQSPAQPSRDGDEVGDEAVAATTTSTTATGDGAGGPTENGAGTGGSADGLPASPSTVTIPSGGSSPDRPTATGGGSTSSNQPATSSQPTTSNRPATTAATTQPPTSQAPATQPASSATTQPQPQTSRPVPATTQPPPATTQPAPSSTEPWQAILRPENYDTSIAIGYTVVPGQLPPGVYWSVATRPCRVVVIDGFGQIAAADYLPGEPVGVQVFEFDVLWLSDGCPVEYLSS